MVRRLIIAVCNTWTRATPSRFRPCRSKRSRSCAPHLQAEELAKTGRNESMTTELSSFLHSLGLEGYLGTFSEEGFEDVESLLLLKEEHLEKLGVKMNHRLKLLEALEVQRDTLMRLLPRVPTSVRLQPNASAPRISTDMVIAKQRGQIFLSYGHDPECTEDCCSPAWNRNSRSGWTR